MTKINFAALQRRYVSAFGLQLVRLRYGLAVYAPGGWAGFPGGVALLRRLCAPDERVVLLRDLTLAEAEAQAARLETGAACELAERIAERVVVTAAFTGRPDGAAAYQLRLARLRSNGAGADRRHEQEDHHD